MSKVPRFDKCEPVSETTSKVMRQNRSRDTGPELLLRRALWKRGLRYRLHSPDLPGKPDIVFRRQRVAVFCDGDFWHGKNWARRRQRLERGANAAYWVSKIESNLNRDLTQTRALEALGWTVLRIWESDIKTDPATAALMIVKVLENRSRPTSVYT